MSNTGLKATLHPEDQDDPAARYPGYLGVNFQSGTGTFVIYNIHREFRSHLMLDDAGDCPEFS